MSLLSQTCALRCRQRPSFETCWIKCFWPPLKRQGRLTDFADGASRRASLNAVNLDGTAGYSAGEAGRNGGSEAELDSGHGAVAADISAAEIADVIVGAARDRIRGLAQNNFR